MFCLGFNFDFYVSKIMHLWVGGLPRGPGNLVSGEPGRNWGRGLVDRKLVVCVYSNSRNDVPRVAQRYGTFAAHTRRRASVLVVFVVFTCTCTVLPV